MQLQILLGSEKLIKIEYVVLVNMRFFDKFTECSPCPETRFKVIPKLLCVATMRRHYASWCAYRTISDRKLLAI